MFDISNITALMESMTATGLGPFLSFLVVIFGVTAGVWLVFDFLHNRHVEQLAKNMVDTTSIAVQSVQNMVTMAITATQGMDVTEKVLKQSQPKNG